MSATVLIMLALLAVLLCLGAFSAVRHISGQAEQVPAPAANTPAEYEDI